MLVWKLRPAKKTSEFRICLLRVECIQFSKMLVRKWAVMDMHIGRFAATVDEWIILDTFNRRHAKWAMRQGSAVTLQWLYVPVVRPRPAASPKRPSSVRIGPSPEQCFNQCYVTLPSGQPEWGRAIGLINGFKVGAVVEK